VTEYIEEEQQSQKVLERQSTLKKQKTIKKGVNEIE